MRGGAILVAALWVPGCSGSAVLQLPIEDPVVAGEPSFSGRPDAGDLKDPPDSGTAELPALPTGYPRPCPEIYADDFLPTFEVEVSAQDWALMEEAFARIQAKQPGAELWHPITFRYRDQVIPDAMMRIRGNSTSCGGMQFALSFNRLDDKGRFQGMRRMNLDHGGCRLFQERLALWFMRDLGVPAACASHVRLMVNGSYYGLFLNIEHVNKDFLKRNFKEHDGNLYKYGRELKTNEETADTDDLKAYRRAQDLAGVLELVDLEQAVEEWAAEAVLPARDNYWLTNWNYYLYHHPSRGFLFLPNDLDQSFPQATGEEAMDTILPRALQHPADVALADPVWRARYLDAVRRASARYDVAKFEERIDAWWEVMEEAAKANPYKRFDAGHVEWFKGKVRARAQWLEQWEKQALP